VLKRPWNIPDLPVFSLVTQNESRFNMNICTYVTAISMQPKLYAIAIYKGTQTLDYALKSDSAVLQLLNKNHFTAVKKLGQGSGFNYDKISWLQKKNMLDEFCGFPVLQGTCANMLLSKVRTLDTGGDHLLYIYKVEKYKSQSEHCLTTKILRDKGIIRA
jgi:flavin reductase (DIM6/NTAB) family NADH-FMN oxidoreductase RutF